MENGSHIRLSIELLPERYRSPAWWGEPGKFGGRFCTYKMGLLVLCIFHGYGKLGGGK